MENNSVDNSDLIVTSNLLKAYLHINTTEFAIKINFLDKKIDGRLFHSDAKFLIENIKKTYGNSIGISTVLNYINPQIINRIKNNLKPRSAVMISIFNGDNRRRNINNPKENKQKFKLNFYKYDIHGEKKTQISASFDNFEEIVDEIKIYNMDETI